MVSPISKALSEGFTSQQVVDYLIKKFPQQAAKIKKALTYGFTSDQVLSSLSKNQKRKGSPSQAETEFESTRRRDIENQSARSQGTLKAGLLAASSLVAPTAISALQRALPSALSSLAPSLMPQPPQQMPPQSASSLEPPIEAPNVAQQGQPVQPEIKTSKVNNEELLNKHLLKSHVDQLFQTNKDPKAIAAILYNKYPAEMKQFQKEAGKNMEDAIADYVSQKMESQGQELDVSKEAPEIKFEKGSVAISPQGVGEIKEIRNGKAIIDIDGKKHQVDEEELEDEPESIKSIDFEKMAQEYVTSIPESERSTAMLFNFFQPVSTNEKGEEEGQFFVIFPSDPSHIGIYDKVPKSLYESINSASTAPKTSGETVLGKYEKDKADSRYAAATDLRKYPEKYPYKKLPIPYNLAQKLFDALKSLQKKKDAEERRKKRQAT